MITRAISKAYQRMGEKRWDKTYWAFDLHETIIRPNWQVNNIPTQFYPHAREAMQLITDQSEIVMIMYTCSHPEEIGQYLEFFKSHDIYFNYVNCNPEVANGGFGYYDDKPYFNVLFEDKAGFDAEEDWIEVVNLMRLNDGRPETEGRNHI